MISSKIEAGQSNKVNLQNFFATLSLFPKKKKLIEYNLINQILFNHRSIK